MQPHTLQPRIVTVDALRGFALLGILFAHFTYWHSGGPLPGAIYRTDYGIGSGIAATINGIFIQGKFYTFFAFLFGLSFFLQMQSLQKHGGNFATRYAWRLTLLLAIGLLHHSFWMGDILSIYALLGFLLLPMRKLNSKTLMIIGVLLIFNVPGKLWEIINFFIFHTVNPDENGLIGERYQQVIQHGTFRDIIILNWQALRNKFYFQVFSGRLMITLGFFVLGMFAGRKKWFENLDACRPTIKKVVRKSGLIVLSTLIVAAALYFTNEIFKLGWQDNQIVGFFFGILFDINSAAMTLFYISGLTMLMYRLRWQRILYPLAPVGKMALTSYLLQTFFGLLLFYHVGFGLFMKTTPGWNWGIAFSIYAMQVLFSRWWFQYFKYGPVEWLWRSGTMMKWQPFLKLAKQPGQTAIAT